MLTKELIVERLNKALRLDRNFVEKLVNTRYVVCDEYANSDEFVCMLEGDIAFAGLLGLLNGLVGELEESRIAGNYDDNGTLICFSLISKESLGPMLAAGEVK